jgi:hypothetical protein
MVEHYSEEVGVGGSKPLWSTKKYIIPIVKIEVPTNNLVLRDAEAEAKYA